MVAGLAERERLREAFGTYLDREVAEYILSEGFTEEGVEVEVTVLFCDVRDFTEFATERAPQEVVARAQPAVRGDRPDHRRARRPRRQVRGRRPARRLRRPGAVPRPRRPRGARRLRDRRRGQRARRGGRAAGRRRRQQRPGDRRARSAAPGGSTSRSSAARSTSPPGSRRRRARPTTTILITGETWTRLSHGSRPRAAARPSSRGSPSRWRCTRRGSRRRARAGDRSRPATAPVVGALARRLRRAARPPRARR